MTAVVILLLALVVVGAVTLAVLEWLIRKPAAGAAMFFGVNVISAAAGKALDLAAVGGTSVKLSDAFFVLMVAAAVARYLRWQNFTVGQRVALVFGVLVLLSFLRGVPAFGVAGASNEFRGILPYAAGTLYFASVLRDSEIQGIIKAWVWAGVPLTLLVFVRWAGWLGGVNIGPLEAVYDAPSRVLDGPQTFFLVQIGLVALLSAPRVSIGILSQRHLGFIFLLVGVLLNRRTAWVTVVVALAIVVVRGRDLTPKVRRSVIGATALVVILLFGFAGGLVQESLDPGAGDRAVAEVDETGTLNWRIAGWQQIMSESRGPAEWLVGVPFGAGFSRMLGFSEVDVNPHNFYIQVFGRVGLIGFALLLVMLLGGAWVLSRRARGRVQAPHQELLLVLLAMHLIWYVTWQPGMDGGLLTGLVAGYGFRIGESQRSDGMPGSGAPSVGAATSGRFKARHVSRTAGNAQ